MRAMKYPGYLAVSENLGIKACDRDKSGVYTREHFVEGAQRSKGWMEMSHLSIQPDFLFNRE